MKTFYLFLLIIFTTLSGFSQNQPLDNIVIAAAPHVPVMQAYDGTGAKFQGSKFTYKYEENLTSLKSWIESYPAEVPKYKATLHSLITNTDVSVLSNEDLIMFDGFAAQYKMLKSIAN